MKTLKQFKIILLLMICLVLIYSPLYVFNHYNAWIGFILIPFVLVIIIKILLLIFKNKNKK